jgi:hypothetical protein
MTFPVGSKPTGQAVAAAAVPFKSVAFTGGGSDMDLTDPANGCTPCAFELYATATGTIVAQLAGDSSPQSYPVSQGQVLQGAFVLIKSTSSNCIARQ